MEEFWTKVYLLWPFLIALLAGFVMGVPLAHAVSVGDTALSQAGTLAITGANATAVQSAVTTIMDSGLPTQMGSTVLFNPSTDVSVVPNVAGTTETLQVTYDAAIFAPFVQVFGWTGPTLPLTFTKTVSVATQNDEGVTYLQ